MAKKKATTLLTGSFYEYLKEMFPLITVIKADFVLSQKDIDDALNSEVIMVKGKQYKVPRSQLRAAKPGIVTLEMEMLANETPHFPLPENKPNIKLITK